MIHLCVGKTTFGAKSVDLKGIGGGRKEERFEIKDKVMGLGWLRAVPRG